MLSVTLEKPIAIWLIKKVMMGSLSSVGPKTTVAKEENLQV